MSEYKIFMCWQPS